jgi:hypothetical protein
MWNLIKELFSSKKFVVMLAAALFAVANKVGLNVSEDLVNQIVGLAAAFIVGQGIADAGKEKAKIEVPKTEPIA